MSILSLEERAWLACAIDTDGSLFWAGPGSMYPKVRVYNTNKDFVERFASLVGGKTYGLKRTGYGVAPKGRPRPLRAKPLWFAELARYVELKGLLELVLPYLIVKKERAAKILKWLNENPRIFPKFSKSQVTEIRSLAADLSQSELARRYGCTQPAIGYILKRSKDRYR